MRPEHAAPAPCPMPVARCPLPRARVQPVVALVAILFLMKFPLVLLLPVNVQEVEGRWRQSRR